MSKQIPSTLDPDDGAMYVSERKVYPRDVQGRFTRLRTAALFWLLGMYYLFPWLTWDGRQAVLFDLPARKFYVFGLAFWPQDFIFLALLLIMAGLSLFFFTAVAGRLWCGYACPQTVWTEVFLWMERWTEGDRHKRIKLDAGPWSAEKVRRKGSKHLIWLLFALWTGFTFVGFFTPIQDLGARLLTLEWSAWETFWVLFYSLATWGNAGVLREQVCKYMCPYARFQGAMFDRNTLIISYDPLRGEPRGPRKRGALASVLERARGLLSPERAHEELVRAAGRRSAADRQAAARLTTGALDIGKPLPERGPLKREQLGDCIDCTLCVQVCPTGIDIRNGLQYECIACGACIDACDSVMERMDYPRGLIRYTTQNAVDGKPSKVLRPRVLAYGTLLALICLGWLYGVFNREPLLVDVLRDRNALYRVAPDGRIENAYTLKLVNKQGAPVRLRVEVAGGAAEVVGGPLDVRVEAEEVASLPLTLTAPAGGPGGRRDIELRVTGLDDARLSVTHVARFFAPEEGSR
ncbi:4Fe-4S dicluster domain-containing protein [Pseudomarimonas salicorniae]|uniref:4Fe-4S binding protein n=1 Tax=Pseudomarimonas salicorniae TaxID=2933270 RepID=A0ABT0GDX6_9GAMM|nr:4Fe-4S dicluster domain-containing protein [Lysobacter sp. CAU 1642]MCK7592759.1 4Fe-4S binding protein [Lysobacter sp. CAU 1642]